MGNVLSNTHNVDDDSLGIDSNVLSNTHNVDDKRLKSDSNVLSNTRNVDDNRLKSDSNVLSSTRNVDHSIQNNLNTESKVRNHPINSNIVGVNKDTNSDSYSNNDRSNLSNNSGVKIDNNNDKVMNSSISVPKDSYPTPTKSLGKQKVPKLNLSIWKPVKLIRDDKDFSPPKVFRQSNTKPRYYRLEDGDEWWIN